MTDIVLPLAIFRDNLITSNSRLHWADKAKRTRAIRDMAHVLCRHEHRHLRLDGADLAVESRWPDRRRRDASLIAPMVKAAVDGCVDAGLFADDNHTILRSERYVIGDVIKDQPWIACWLRLTFTPIGGTE